MRASGATEPVTAHALRGRVSALVGSGGNIAVSGRPRGQGPRRCRSYCLPAADHHEALARLGRGPVTHLVNTHWHFDHADGNAWLNAQGARIIAHENTRKHLAKATRVEDWNFDFPPAPRAALPTELIGGERTLKLNGETIRLTHPGPAHTDGDLIVRFDEADVLHGGDIYWRSYPFIDYSTGGSIDGTIRGTEAMLASAGQSDDHNPGSWRPGEQPVSSSVSIGRCSAKFVKNRRTEARWPLDRGSARGETDSAFRRYCGVDRSSPRRTSPDWSTPASDPVVPSSRPARRRC
jgi:glyoxylase-like metal-dependent hydrolase (beta-lactamase superfamily II)